MEKGNRNKRWFFLWALPAILAVFFVFYSGFAIASEKIIISAVQTSGDKADDDFIELYNQGCDGVDLTGWKIKKRTADSGGKDMDIGTLKKSIPAKGYFLWENVSANLDDNPDYATKTYYLFNNYSIALINDDEIIDSITWGNNSNSFAGSLLYADNLQKSETLLRDEDDSFTTEFNYSPKNSSYVNESALEDCLQDEPEPTPEPEIYSDEIWINELLPNPADGEDEYIELYNNSDEKIELKNWSLHDASKSGEYIFSEKDEIESEEYLVVYGETFKFALNNGGDEKVTLYDPNGKSVFEITYHGSKKGVSYNFDGEKWHWSSLLTPGTENIFEEIPNGKIKIDKKVFVEVFANFEVVGLSKKAKVAWDFGDGHKSYLQKTKHKYKKTGEYEASVKYSEGSEDVTEKFTIEVEKIKHPEVKIVAVNANPVGSDTKNETITVQNKSKKKINLMGWSIATGWKKLVNHPITEKIEIKAGKKKEITRESSKFTLNNKKAEIELRYPDGKVAYSVKYKKEDKGIAEGEMYVKEKGGWSWQIPVASIKYNVSSINTKNSEIINQESEENSQEIVEEKNSGEIVDEDVGIVVKKKEMPALLAVQNQYFAKTKISSGEPLVLGAETVRESDGIYFFTPEIAEQEHYAFTFLKNIFAIINARINFVINLFSN